MIGRWIGLVGGIAMASLVDALLARSVSSNGFVLRLFVAAAVVPPFYLLGAILDSLESRR